MQTTTTQNACKQAALSIALGICRDAVWQDKRCNWIGSGSEENYGMPRGYARALNPYFYDGIAGIAWFLLHTHIVTPHAVVQKTLYGVLDQLVAEEAGKKQTGEQLMGKLGFHTGWTGVVWVLWHAGDVLQHKQYTKAALALLEKITKLDKAWWGLDLIDGAAGAVPALIQLSKKIPMPSLKDFILSIAGYLIEKADKQPNGWSWNTMQERTNNLTGYGHGAAGFAAAFAELFAFTGNKQYLEIAKSVVSYEDGHFHAPQQNWPDFRSFGAAPQPVETVCSIAWCHGAPGIGLARLRMLELTNDPFFAQGASIAVDTTLKSLSVMALGNYSLCHGVFGNAELLLYAAEVLAKPALLDSSTAAAEECITEYLQKGIPVPNGLQSGHETPDFMLGSSGIGYFFLRLAAPDKVPGVLLLR